MATEKATERREDHGQRKFASASMVPESSSAAPSGKLLHVDSARPQLRDAFKSLEAAYDALKAADETHHIAWTLWGEWENTNPRPGAPRELVPPACKRTKRDSGSLVDLIQLVKQ